MKSKYFVLVLSKSTARMPKYSILGLFFLISLSFEYSFVDF